MIVRIPQPLCFCPPWVVQQSRHWPRPWTWVPRVTRRICVCVSFPGIGARPGSSFRCPSQAQWWMMSLVLKMWLMGLEESRMTRWRLQSLRGSGSGWPLRSGERRVVPCLGKVLRGGLWDRERRGKKATLRSRGSYRGQRGCLLIRRMACGGRLGSHRPKHESLCGEWCGCRSPKEQNR